MEPCAAASMTKVSKPVLFALKMTDFQCAHKQESPSHKPMLARYFGRTPGLSRLTQGGSRGSGYPPNFIALAHGKGAPLLKEAPPMQVSTNRTEWGAKCAPLTP